LVTNVAETCTRAVASATTELAAAGFEEARQAARGGAGVIYCRYETGPGTKRCGETVLNVVEM
jgi:hypothetical protein